MRLEGLGIGPERTKGQPRQGARCLMVLGLGVQDVRLPGCGFKEFRIPFFKFSGFRVNGLFRIQRFRGFTLGSGEGL